MKIHELLARDPRSHALANSGQARIDAVNELRAELETFVCDGHYGDAITRILNSYLKNLERPKQDAAWVSGFFGSGKSHLLKMLGHLWVNTEFEDGSSARSLVPNLPDDVAALLKELDTAVARTNIKPFAASGTLPAGSGKFVKMTVLSIILKARGLPEQYAQARFCFWLDEQGYIDKVKKAVEDVGKDWFKELNNLYVSGVIAKAVLECDPHFAADEKIARQTLRAQFPTISQDISTSEFLEMAKLALEQDGQIPLTILVLDEVQQYIGDSTDRAVAITEVTEAIYTQLNSRVMLVASGQAALSATPTLQKLKDRYRINAPLSDADVEAVTRKVLLRKNAASIEQVKKCLQENSGEIDKHLDGTRIAPRADDQKTVVEDYPLLPSRRRFWELCFKALDAQGTHSQLRSQLRILHDSLTELSDRDLGAVITGDTLFTAISANLVQTGVLLNELDLRIRKLDDGTPDGQLRQRICGLVFLISKLPREEGADAGIRATAKTVADLMVDDITKDSGPFRQKVAEELENLAGDSTLMKVGDEYRMQTTEGAEWDASFRTKFASLRNNQGEIEYRRSQLLGAAVQTVVGKVRLSHGACKEKRALYLHTGNTEPQDGADQVVVWLRDGWTTSQKDVESEARKRGQDDAVVHFFLPRKSADEITVQIAESEAARQILDTKGVPSSDAGKEARASMQSRQQNAEETLGRLIQEVVTAATVYQGGGNEIHGLDPHVKLETAAEASLARMYPEFNAGDHKAWGVAVKRAKEGNNEPLKVVDWDKSTDDHPVIKQVLSEVGSGSKGSAIRKTLQASPFGWPRDAIDCALVALHRSGAIRAELNGQPLSAGHLDQNKISTTDFYPEKVRLSAQEKIKLRSLYQDAAVSCKPGEEEPQARVFLDTLKTLAHEAGGEAPCPAVPDLTKVNDLRTLNGSEQLAAILKQHDALKQSIVDWNRASDLKGKRLPAWQMLQQLARHAEHLPVHPEIAPEIDAIQKNRSLLDSADLVGPLVTSAANALRAAVTEQDKAYDSAHNASSAALKSDPTWQKLDPADQQAILKQVGLTPPAPSTIGTNDQLLHELGRADLNARASAAAAVAERVKQALEEAAKKLKPNAKRVLLRAATLEDADAVKKWIAEHEEKLLKAVAEAPVIVG